jgi:hypothetical protein
MDNKNFLLCDDFMLSNSLDLDPDYIYISVNPDLTTHYGHFLHYERRMKEVFNANGCDFICLSNVSMTNIHEDFIIPTFTNDSGHYSFYRNSARNLCWNKSTNEFLYLLASAVKSYLAKKKKKYAGIKYFMYTGSVRLAYQISKVFNEPNSTFVINGFWDFLSLANEDDIKYFRRIKLNSRVKFVSMSDKYSKHVFEITNFLFDFIPNPPPLCSDNEAILRIKKSCMRENNDAQINIYLPSLLTQGKGLEVTQDLISQVNNTNGITFFIRDKTNTLNKIKHKNIKYLVGDLSDENVFQLYETSDFVLIPYDSKTFQMRTSGVIVDCLLFGSVPIVFEDTWMSHICKKYDFGIIAQGTSQKDILNALYDSIPHLRTLRGKMYRAALNYLIDNSWSSLIQRVFINKKHSSSDYLAKRPFDKILTIKNRTTHLPQHIKSYKSYRILLSILFPENTKRRLFVRNFKNKVISFFRTK